jgi:hypothetical protein
MNQQTDYRTSGEALAVMGAWLWLFVGIVTLVGTWGVWFDLRFALICIALSLATLWRDHRKQQKKPVNANAH